MSDVLAPAKWIVRITAAVILLLLGLRLALLVPPYWWLFLLAGSGLISVSFFIPKPQTLAAGGLVSEGDFLAEISGTKTERPDMTTPQFIIPKDWNPAEIGIQLRKLQGNPSLARVLVDSIVTRFVIGQDRHTSKARIEFLEYKLEELELSAQLQSSLDELTFRASNLEIRQMELDQKKQSLEIDSKRKGEISELERQRDALKIKLEMAQLTKQMEELQSPAKPVQVRSAEDDRKHKKEEIEQKIRDYQRQLEEVRAATDLDEPTKRRRENIISKKLEALYEELEKYI
ncbi:MAG TPA: hypothetical protein VFK06_15160 [Candidatus Angelobacter sp.]|nr:hypothetical protein [Candidatus Angelobacter sp.]